MRGGNGGRSLPAPRGDCSVEAGGHEGRPWRSARECPAVGFPTAGHESQPQRRRATSTGETTKGTAAGSPLRAKATSAVMATMLAA